MTEFFERIAGFSQKRLVLLAAELQNKLEHLEKRWNESIAVIGMSCRFPGGTSSPEKYWQLLRDGKDAISEVPSDRWDINEYYDPNPETLGKMTTRWGGFLENMGQFDAAFFGITPRELISMDPQQRLILEVAWETLENGGQNPACLNGSKTGVFIGVSNNDYGRILMSGGTSAIDAYVASGNANSMIAGRLSYILGLQGPSLSVDTACSSSLMAVHLASQSLLLGECNLALAGGVNVILSPEVTVALSRFNMMAPDGRCKAFDADADGFVRGEGCGIVLLKRLSDALASRDRILAVIKGSASNQDGRSMGLTAPNGPSQEAVIHEALKKAKVKPREVGYIEAHGTGTSLGDPIEARALEKTLLRDRHQDQTLYVGSVKTNIGHLESAAGIASLIKTILVLQHGEIPPNLHFKRLNAHIEWQGQPIGIPTERIRWNPEITPRIAGVSSFGFSGTNVHVVMSEAPLFEKDLADEKRRLHLLTLSAKSDEALKELAKSFDDHLAEHDEQSLADICYTANTGRSHFSYRLAITAESAENARGQLQNLACGSKSAEVVRNIRQRPDQPEIVFLFSGQGCQYVGMGRELFDTQPTFRKTLERCDEILRPYLDRPLLSVLYPEAGQSSPLDQTAYTQPALFSMEYSLAELWRSWGIEPSVVMGHSVGEYVAACVAGLFSLEEGLKLIATRGRMMQALPGGGRMVAVFADEARVVRAIAPYGNTVSVAAVNGPESMVISGGGADIEAILKQFEAEGIGFTPLTVSHAFHSPQMEPMLDEFESVASGVTYASPRMGVVSNVSGKLACGEEMADGRYWRRHVREPVRFRDSMELLYSQGYRIFVEVGPHPVLLGMGAGCLSEEGVSAWLPSLKRGEQDWRRILTSLAELYVRGVEVDWNGFDRDYPRRKVALPTYPFERTRYWLTEQPGRIGLRDLGENIVPAAAGHPLIDNLFNTARNETVFTSSINLERLDFLNDHRMHGLTVTPVALFIELVLAALKMAQWKGTALIRDLTIYEPLLLSKEKTVDLQLIFSKPSHQEVVFEIFSNQQTRISEGNSWKLHASGKAGGIPVSAAPESEQIEKLKSENPEYIDGQVYYEKLSKLGAEYGPALRGVREIWSGNGSVLGHLSIPGHLANDPDPYTVHPVILDAAFQTLGAALLSRNVQFTYLTVSLGKFIVTGDLKLTRWALGEIQSGDGETADTVTANIRLLGNDGEHLGHIEGIRLKRSERADWFYEVSWQEKKLAQVSPPMHDDTGVWLIFSDARGTGETLAEVLSGYGNRTILVFAGEAYRHSDGERLYINPNRPDEIRNLLENLMRFEVTSLRGIVHLWSLDDFFSEEDTASALETSQVLCCASVLNLIQQLAKNNWSTPPRVWLVTRGSQTLEGDSGPPSVAQAPLWGLGRVIALEHPEFWGGLVDLDPEGSQDEMLMLVKLIGETEKEDLSAFRRANRHVARLVRCKHCSLPGQPLDLDRDGTYLITGGLGGLGIEVARHLAKRNAGHLVLIGRRKASAQAVEAIKQIEALGTKVDVINADVSLEADIARTLRHIRDCMPPLKGIIHAAGVIEDGVLSQQEWSSFARVMAPKVKGAWNLHALTRGMDLDFFVLFSSATSLFGNSGQGSYAAANAFLDALAHYRHRQGLPALSIDWGAWSEVGMTASLGESVKRQMASKGAGFISPDEGLHAFEKATQLSCGRNGRLPPQIVIMQSNWQEISRLDPVIAKMPILSSIMLEEIKPEEKSTKRTLAAELLSADGAEERLSLIGKYMIDQVAKVVKLSPALIDMHQPVVAIGLDSLMAVELRNQIERDLGVVIPLLKLLQIPSVSELVSLVLEEFTTSAAVLTSARPEGNEIAPAGAKDCAADIDWEEGVL